MFDDTKEIYKGPKIYSPEKVENWCKNLSGEKLFKLTEISAVFGSVGNLIDSQRIKRILNTGFLQQVQMQMSSEQIGDLISSYIEDEIGSKLGTGWALAAGIKRTWSENQKNIVKLDMFTVSQDYSVVQHSEILAIGNPEEYHLGYIQALKDNDLEIDLVKVIESNARRNIYVGSTPAAMIRI